MKCICCNSDKVKASSILPNNYSYCSNCELLFTRKTNLCDLRKSIVSHYQNVDPHGSVAYAKKGFFKVVLDYILANSSGEGKRILDVGCGFGYFLELASERGLEPFGVELSETAANASKLKFGAGKIYHGDLATATFGDEQFDAITLWDVLAIVENPYDELNECYRLLKGRGIIGIRTRNAVFQIIVFRLFKPIEKMALRFGIKRPYVFNRYCFSSRSVDYLLSRIGFININIGNSPLTSGDPYNHIRFKNPAKLSKGCIDICTKLVAFMSRGRRLIAPSILIWAQKP